MYGFCLDYCKSLDFLCIFLSLQNTICLQWENTFIFFYTFSPSVSYHWLFQAPFQTGFVLLIKNTALWRWSPNLWFSEMNRTQLSGISIATCSSSGWPVICWVNSAAESWSLSEHPAKCARWNPSLFLFSPFILPGMKGRRRASPRALQSWLYQIPAVRRAGRPGLRAAEVTKGGGDHRGEQEVMGGRDGAAHANLVGRGLRECLGDFLRCM